MSADGQMGCGDALGCNVTDVGAEAATKSVSLAIQRACDAHPKLLGKQWRPSQFSSIWAGFAGHDRKEVAVVVDQAMENLFKRSMGARLKVTNDIELLASSAVGKKNTDSAVVLVAGTGSVVMSFKREGEEFIRSGRSGGWGYLLGDDGSGFDIGRHGIRAALAALDDFNSQSSSLNKDRVFKRSPLVQRVLDHFRPKETGTVNFDLLSSVLSSSSELDKKRRIAEVAPIVIESSEHDSEAKSIVDNAVKALVRLLDPLTTSGQLDAADSILVLGGGLMQSRSFSDALRDELHGSRKVFQHVEVVARPAMLGAEYLLRKRQG